MKRLMILTTSLLILAGCDPAPPRCLTVEGRAPRTVYSHAPALRGCFDYYPAPMPPGEPGVETVCGSFTVADGACPAVPR